MSPTVLAEQLQASMALFALIAGPPLAAALVVGLFVGVLQAATQIQDQTLPMTFKLAAVFLVLVAAGATLMPPLVAHTQRLLDDFPALTRG